MLKLLPGEIGKKFRFEIVSEPESPVYVAGTVNNRTLLADISQWLSLVRQSRMGVRLSEKASGSNSPLS